VTNRRQRQEENGRRNNEYVFERKANGAAQRSRRRELRRHGGGYIGTAGVIGEMKEIQINGGAAELALSETCEDLKEEAISGVAGKA